MNEAVKEILEVFSREDIREYPREAMTQALQHEEELTPHLMAILENLYVDHKNFMEREGYFGHIFAMNLLAHFENQNAHEIIVKIMALPRDVVDPLFGDLVTEDFPRILYQTCGGRYKKIVELVLNVDLDDYVRGSAMQALVFGVLLDDFPRSEALDFFNGLFTGSESQEDTHFWDAAASCVHDLYPEELMETIENAYERGLIWPGYIGIESFQRALSVGKENFLQKTKQDLEQRIMEDFHDYMSWWACFDQPDHSQVSAQTEIAAFEDRKNRQKTSKKKKSRRKAARASKRKNRRP